MDRHLIGGEHRWGVREQIGRCWLGLEHLGLTVRELDTSPDQSDEVRCIDSAPALLSRRSSLIAIARAAFREPARGEFVSSGLTNKSLRQHPSHKNTGQVSRLLRRLRVHGLIKKVGKRYKYYLTDFGRQAILMVPKLRKIVIIRELARGHTACA